MSFIAILCCVAGFGTYILLDREPRSSERKLAHEKQNRAMSPLEMNKYLAMLVGAIGGISVCLKAWGLWPASSNNYLRAVSEFGAASAKFILYTDGRTFKGGASRKTASATPPTLSYADQDFTDEGRATARSTTVAFAVGR
jgi:hypothetical protein